MYASVRVRLSLLSPEFGLAEIFLQSLVPLFITASQQSCGKVMILQASANHTVHGEGGWMAIPCPMSLPVRGYLWSKVPSREWVGPRGGRAMYPVPVCMDQSRSWVCPPLPLTSSGGYHTYGCQARGTYPTGMVSCLFIQISGGKVELVAVRKSTPFQTQPRNSRIQRRIDDHCKTLSL